MKDVSSLMDGELDARRARSTIQRVEDHDELWDAWSTFHLIRDTLQGNPVVPGRFNQRLHERLLQEPPPPPPPWWRRALLSRRVLASGALLGLLLLVLLLIGLVRAPAPPSRPAAAPVPVPGVEPILDDPRLLAFVSAHRPMLPLPAEGAEGLRP